MSNVPDIDAPWSGVAPRFTAGFTIALGEHTASTIGVWHPKYWSVVQRLGRKLQRICRTAEPETWNQFYASTEKDLKRVGLVTKDGRIADRIGAHMANDTTPWALHSSTVSFAIGVLYGGFGSTNPTRFAAFPIEVMAHAGRLGVPHKEMIEIILQWYLYSWIGGRPLSPEIRDAVTAAWLADERQTAYEIATRRELYGA